MLREGTNVGVLTSFYSDKRVGAPRVLNVKGDRDNDSYRGTLLRKETLFNKSYSVKQRERRLIVRIDRFTFTVYSKSKKGFTDGRRDKQSPIFTHVYLLLKTLLTSLFSDWFF